MPRARCGSPTSFVLLYEWRGSGQENADPSAKRDLEIWLNRLVPEGGSLYRHTSEGSDDMPANIKAALTATSLSIPVSDGRLVLGSWQGIFLWEHRRAGGVRRRVVHIGA